MIKKISHKLTEAMKSIAPRSEEECIKIEYMIEVLLSRYLVIVAVLLICKLVGNLDESFFCMMAFLFLRVFAGGTHMNTNIGCTIVSSLIVVGGGFVVHYINIPELVYVVFLVIDIFIMYLFAPMLTDNMPITDKYRTIRKIESAVIVGIVLVLFIIVPNIYTKSFALGVTLEALTVLPQFNKK